MYRNQLSVEEMCKKLRPAIGSKVDKIFLAWRMAESPQRRIQLEQALNALYVRHVDESMLKQGIMLEPPAKDQVSGSYPVGNVAYANNELFPFGLRDRDFPRHICITGMSGSGKTNLGFHILKTLIDKKIPFIVFDWKKSFRQLYRFNKDINIFTVGNENIANLFHTNINEPPPQVGPKEWINILADLANESFYASHGVHKLISEALDEAYKEFGVYKGSKNYPTWHQIRDRLQYKEDEHKQGREREWLTSALRIAHSLTFGGFGDAVNSKDKYGIKVENLMDKQTVFELHALGQSEKKFFSEYLLTYIFRLKKAMVDNKEFGFAIVVDEAHNIFLKDKTFFLKESITESIYREIREYGVSLICMDQHISKLSDVVPGNSACNIAFQQMLPQDINESAGVMQLFDHKDYFSMLPVGSCIVRLAERYHRPFQVNVPLVQMGEKVLDKEVQEHMAQVTKEHQLRALIDDCKEETKEEQFVEEEPDELTAAEKRVKELKEKLERKYQKEHDKINEKYDTEFEKLSQKEMRKVATVYNPNEPKTPLKKEHEALEVIHGPREFAVQESLRPGKRPDGFQEEEFPHLGRVLKINEINNIQQLFVAAVQRHPDLSVTQLYKRLGLSARKGNKIKQELIDAGILEVFEAKSEKGWKKLLRVK